MLVLLMGHLGNFMMLLVWKIKKGGEVKEGREILPRAVLTDWCSLGIMPNKYACLLKSQMVYWQDRKKGGDIFD